MILFAQVGQYEDDQAEASNIRLQKAIDLYYMGNFDNATVILSLLVESGKLSRENLLKAHQYLGALFVLQNYPENARNEIVHALKLEPKLTLDPAEWDPLVFNYFNLVKSQVLGSLRIETEPDGAEVFLNDSLAGQTPLFKENMVIGDYLVYFEKPGYRSRIDTVKVRPNTECQISVTLKRKPKIWLIVTGALAAGIIVYGMFKKEGELSELEPLGAPPEPPSGH